MEKKLINVFYPILAFTIWGTLFVASRYTTDYLSIPTIGFYRLLIATIPLYLVLRKHRSVRIKKKDYKYFILIGLMGYFINIDFNLAGIKFAGASLAALVTMLNPFLISLLAAVFLKEKLTKRKIFCLLLSIGGVYIVLLGNIEGGKLVGVLLALFAVLNWSFSSVLMRKLNGSYDPLVVTCYCMLVSLCFHLPAFIFEEVVFGFEHFTWQMVLSLLYMGLIGTGLAMLLWNKSLANNDASTCTLFFPIQVFVSAFLGAMLLGETVDAIYYVGMTMCTASILLNFFAKAEKPDSKINIPYGP